jgi:hypothetical protein
MTDRVGTDLKGGVEFSNIPGGTDQLETSEVGAPSFGMGGKNLPTKIGEAPIWQHFLSTVDFLIFCTVNYLIFEEMTSNASKVRSRWGDRPTEKEQFLFLDHVGHNSCNGTADPYYGD